MTPVNYVKYGRLSAVLTTSGLILFILLIWGLSSFEGSDNFATYLSINILRYGIPVLSILAVIVNTYLFLGAMTGVRKDTQHRKSLLWTGLVLFLSTALMIVVWLLWALLTGFHG